mmetsp:Transcript_2875/g.7895  ORF Transcript_2875/g.7895 Transcript_2875/m.7895 type:complete len:106 (-) Transcript_2875:122-439(-)
MRRAEESRMKASGKGCAAAPPLLRKFFNEEQDPNNSPRIGRDPAACGPPSSREPRTEDPHPAGVGSSIHRNRTGNPGIFFSNPLQRSPSMEPFNEGPTTRCFEKP